MSRTDLIQGWGRWLINRPRPFAIQQADGSYRWIWESCTREHLARHLVGEQTLAVSSLDGSGWCRWVCLDVDQVDGLPQLVALRDQLTLLGFPGIVEGSRRGGHLWLCFKEAVPAARARSAIRGVLDRLSQQGMRLPVHEQYPDTASSGALGHAVRLPLGIHRLTGRRYPLLGADGLPLAFSSLEGTLSWFLAQPRISAHWLQASWELPRSAAPDVPIPANSSTRSAVIRWVDAQVNPLDLLAEYAPASSMRRVGRGYLGYCAFHPDTAPQEDGSPGSPSLYVRHHQIHGWEWRCLSTNCRFWGYPMRHSFRLFCELQGLDARAGISAARQHWPASPAPGDDDATGD